MRPRMVKRTAPKRRRGFVPHAMTADSYLMGHWDEKRLWRSSDKGHHAERFVFIANAVTGERFLDCGCAFGHSTAKLAEMHPGHWEGADFSRSGIERARENFPDLVFNYCEHAEDLNKLGPYDTVVMSEILEHVEDDRAFVEAGLNIAPRLVVTTPCRNVGDPGHRRLYTDETLKALLRGYSVVIKKHEPFFFVVASRRAKGFVKVIGDSHAFYTFRSMPGIINQHIGPVTLKRVGYKEDTSVQHAADMLAACAEDTFLFIFGEIDVRTFVKRWYERRKDKLTLDGMLAEWARLYVEALAAVDLKGAKRGVIGIPPPAAAANIHAKAYPVVGTDAERANYTQTLNRHIKAECEARGWPFVDIYSAYAGTDGMLPIEVTERETHIGNSGPVQTLMREMGLLGSRD